MTLLKTKLQDDKEEKRAIDEKVRDTPIRPTQDESELVQQLSEQIAAQFREEIVKEGFTEEIKGRIRNAVEEMTEGLEISYETKKRIEAITISTVTGLGPIEPYLHDDSVTEILVQRYDNIVVERAGKVYAVDAAFTDESQLRTIIGRIVQPVGRQINLYTPMVDARLPDGSRVNATIPPATPDGATLSIRKFSDRVLTGADYLEFGSLDKRMLYFLAKCVESRLSMIVSGGTTSGKTTLLNMLSQYIPGDELIITIEDSCELKLNQRNIRRMEARANNAEGMMPITIQNLVRNALRMRPDRIIVGEIRDGTVVDMMSSMSTGHEGSMSTVHANSPQNLINSRLPILYSMNNTTSFTQESQAMQISEALHLIVHIGRSKATGERKITHITHVAGLNEDRQVLLRDIFVYNQKNKCFEATGYIPEDILAHARANGVDIDRVVFRAGPHKEEPE